jgi:hypothetical protein
MRRFQQGRSGVDGGSCRSVLVMRSADLSPWLSANIDALKAFHAQEAEVRLAYIVAAEESDPASVPLFQVSRGGTGLEGAHRWSGRPEDLYAFAEGATRHDGLLVVVTRRSDSVLMETQVLFEDDRARRARGGLGGPNVIRLRAGRVIR